MCKEGGGGGYVDVNRLEGVYGMRGGGGYVDVNRLEGSQAYVIYHIIFMFTWIIDPLEHPKLFVDTRIPSLTIGLIVINRVVRGCVKKEGEGGYMDDNRLEGEEGGGVYGR